MDIGVVAGTLIILAAFVGAGYAIYWIVTRNRPKEKAWHADPFVERVAGKKNPGFQVVTPGEMAGTKPKGHRDLESIKEALDAYRQKPGMSTLLPLQAELGVLKPPLTGEEAHKIGTTLEQVAQIMAASL